MNSHFDPFIEQPAKKHWFQSESHVKLLAAMLSLLTTVVAVFIQKPKTFLIILGTTSAVLITATFVPVLFRLLRNARNKSRSKQYVREQYPRLERLHEKLLQFTDQSNGYSLRGILQTLSLPHNPAIQQITSSDYIRSWIECYGAGLEVSRPQSLVTFLQKCNELTAIINEYNRNYVLKAQKLFEATPPNPPHILDNLEAFREDFVHYLREVEEWVASLKSSAITIEPNLYHLGRIIPCGSFEKAKSFTKSTSTSSK